MTTVLRAGMIAVLVLSGCSDGGIVAPGTRPDTAQEGRQLSALFSAAISEPVPTAVANQISDRFVSNVYVAFAVAELPDVRTVRISNVSAGFAGAIAFPVTNGALDPVPVPASIGDTLELQLTKVDGSSALLRAVVPAERAPRVIRTNPSMGRRDVALNSKIVVVFSEPMDAIAITNASFQLTAMSQPVRLRAVPIGTTALAVELAPDAPLLPNALSQLVVTRSLRDLHGDSLQRADTVHFTTVDTTGRTGQEIAFVSGRDGNSEIYLVKENGTGLLRLTFNDVADTDPAWSPDGKRIAFTRGDERYTDIYIMNADGSNLVRRTHTESAREPAWSPDGSKIAFTAHCDGQGCINVIAADSGEGAAIRLGTARGFHADPAWSADGTEVAFVSDWDGFDFVYDIFVAKADGSGITQLTRGFGYVPGPPGGLIPIKWSLHPTYSRDGRIAFLSFDPHWGTRSQPPFIEQVSVAVMNGDGTKVTIVAAAGENSRFGAFMPPSLSWSPDDRKIAFSSGVCAGPFGEKCSYSLFIVGADGTLPPQLLLSDGHSPTWRSR